MNLLKDLGDIFVPKRCTHCNNIINEQQQFLCSFCFSKLEYTNFLNYKNNPLEKLFWGHVNVTKATSIYFYQKNSPIQTLLKKLKYEGLQDFGLYAAKTIIYNIDQNSHFKNIDIVTIMPLHPLKEKQRGYNQIELFGKTISKHLNKPFYRDILLKTNNNKSQTTQNKELRYQNVENSFKPNKTHNINNKHILLVDDVLTTGATLISCCKTLQKSSNVNISIITIACVV